MGIGRAGQRWWWGSDDLRTAFPSIGGVVVGSGALLGSHRSLVLVRKVTSMIGTSLASRVGSRAFPSVWDGAALIACRPLTESQALTRVVSVAQSLAATASVLEGGLSLRLGVVDGGGVQLRVRTSSMQDSGVGQAVAEALWPIGDVAACTDVVWPETVWVWDLVPVVAGGSPGFLTGAATMPSRWEAALGGSALLVEIDELTGLLSRHPDVTYCVEVEVGSSTSSGSIVVRPRLECVTETLPVAAQALVRRIFPGLRVAAREHVGSGPGLLVESATVPAVLRMPVATDVPLSGVAVAAASARAIAPTVASFGGSGQRAGEVRLGCARTADRRSVDVRLTRSERERHVHVLGKTGTGKSTLLAAMAGEIAAAGECVIVLDPHSQLVERIASELPAEVAERSWLIRAGDLDDPFRFNPLSVADPQQRELVIAEIGQMFQRLYDPSSDGIVGPRFLERCSMALRALSAISGPRASMLDVPGFFADDCLVAAVKNHPDTEPRLARWLDNERALKRSTENGELHAWVSSKFEQISGTPAMRSILGTGENSIDWNTAMDGGRVILIDLSLATLGQTASRLLGMLLVNAVWNAVLLRGGATPVTLMIDEAHSFHSGSMDRILSEGRKFGLSLVLAHQYLDQLHPELRSALDGNAGTTVAFRSSPADGRALSDRFADPATAVDLPILPDLHALTLRSAATIAARPFTLHIDHNDRPGRLDTENRQVLRDNTRRELVDPYRNARPLFDADRITQAYRALEEATSPTAGAASSPDRVPRSEFLAAWLEKRATDIPNKEDQ